MAVWSIKPTLLSVKNIPKMTTESLLKTVGVGVNSHVKQKMMNHQSLKQVQIYGTVIMMLNWLKQLTVVG